ncbi:glycine-rich protein DC7.1-like [Andrographis paniculata]|uniref:glycine-rich protein DC7.1-like n=1 Tax=Andrographis paniculata TaxID=175694 RepID=UPI0021E8951D|nr:glycine-rich protein DC7.1-like [Andrographis paniculata]
MATSKAVAVLILFLAAFLMIASEVAARDLAENTDATQQDETAPWGYGGWRQGGGTYGSSCPYFCENRCCSATEKAEFDALANP